MHARALRGAAPDRLLEAWKCEVEMRVESSQATVFLFGVLERSCVLLARWCDDFWMFSLFDLGNPALGAGPPQALKSKSRPRPKGATHPGSWPLGCPAKAVTSEQCAVLAIKPYYLHSDGS